MRKQLLLTTLCLAAQLTVAHSDSNLKQELVKNSSSTTSSVSTTQEITNPKPSLELIAKKNLKQKDTLITIPTLSYKVRPNDTIWKLYKKQFAHHGYEGSTIQPNGSEFNSYRWPDILMIKDEHRATINYVSLILGINNINSPKDIKAGQTLYVPNFTSNFIASKTYESSIEVHLKGHEKLCWRNHHSPNITFNHKIVDMNKLTPDYK